MTDTQGKAILSAQNQASKSTKRTQAQRSSSMQKRLLDATIQCLSVEGYAGTTIGKIAKYADTSNGTPLHHYQNKAAIIEAAAEQLLKDISRDTAELFNQSTSEFSEGLEEVRNFVRNTFQNNALIEIILASKRDEQLRKAISPVFIHMANSILKYSEQWFEATSDDHELRDLLMILQWVIRGLAFDAHLMGNQKTQDHFIAIVLKFFSEFIQKKSP